MKINNKIVKLLLMASIALMLLSSCEKERGRAIYPYSQPKMSNLRLSVENQVKATDSLFFSVNISDEETPLSTLDVSFATAGKVIYSESIRTKGYESNIKQHGIYIPFTSGLENDKEATLTLTAINVEGSKQIITKTLTIQRPRISSTIYLHYNDLIIPMKQQEDNPYLYVTDEGNYPMQLTGRISTNEALDNSDLIWGNSDSTNEATLISKTDPGFSFDFQDWQIKQITFNIFTFKLGAIGYQKNITINGTKLEASGGYFRASINFKKGQSVEVTGLDDLINTYNRDFFDYDPGKKTLTFLRETGNWEVYYSATYNYMWVEHLNDVAPNAFWIIGHGFTCAPVWNTDYDHDGWSIDNISRMAYAVKVGDHKYQASMYISNTHEWGSFEFEIYSDLGWNKNSGMLLQEGSISGDSEGFAISGSNGLTNTESFIPGYYCLTFDTSAGVGKETVTIKRISN